MYGGSGNGVFLAARAASPTPHPPTLNSPTHISPTHPQLTKAQPCFCCSRPHLSAASPNSALLCCAQCVTDQLLTVMLVICAVIISKLSDISNQRSRTITWYDGALMSPIYSHLAPSLNASALAGFEALGQGAKWAAASSYCTQQLPTTCASALTQRVGVSGFNITFGQEFTWSNRTSQLVNERPIRQVLRDAAAGGSDAAAYGHCLGCYCLGLRSIDLGGLPTGEQVILAQSIKDTCRDYINNFDL